MTRRSTMHPMATMALLAATACSGPAGVGAGDLARTTPAVLQAGCRLEAATADQLPAITVLGKDCPRLTLVAPAGWRYRGPMTLIGVEYLEVIGEATVEALTLAGPTGKPMTVSGNLTLDGAVTMSLSAPLIVAQGRLVVRGPANGGGVTLRGGGIIVDGGTLIINGAVLDDCGIAIPRGRVQLGHVRMTRGAAPASGADDGKTAAVTVGRDAQLSVDGPLTMAELPGDGIAAQAGGDQTTTQVEVTAPIEFPDHQAGQEPLYVPDSRRSRHATRIVTNFWLQDAQHLAARRLLGTFVGGCTFVPDGQGGGTSLRETLTFKVSLEDGDPKPDVFAWYWNDPWFVHAIDQFSDDGCSVPDRTTRRAGAFYLYADPTGITDMIDFDYRTEDWIPRTAEMVQGFNNGSVCGYADWQIDQPRPVHGRVCFKNGDYELKIKLAPNLDLFRLQGNVLTLGPAPDARHPDYKDFRPTDLDEKRRFERVLPPGGSQSESNGTRR